MPLIFPKFISKFDTYDAFRKEFWKRQQEGKLKKASMLFVPRKNAYFYDVWDFCDDYTNNAELATAARMGCIDLLTQFEDMRDFELSGLWIKIKWDESSPWELPGAGGDNDKPDPLARNREKITGKL